MIKSGRAVSRVNHARMSQHTDTIEAGIKGLENLLDDTQDSRVLSQANHARLSASVDGLRLHCRDIRTFLKNNLPDDDELDAPKSFAELLSEAQAALELLDE